MFNFLGAKNINKELTITDFGYLKPNEYYFDSACQTLRPESVIQSEINYYHNFNSCGHRVKYPWGEKTDKLVNQTRQDILDLVGKNSKEYVVVFNTNTTQGINQVLHQLPEIYYKIIISEIEHNSVFIPSISWAEKRKLPRFVLPRNEDLYSANFGSLIYQVSDLEKAVVLLNSSSNIDGRKLLNLEQITADVHSKKGIVLIDACQTFGHNPEFLRNIDFDAAFGSGHKMYGPSLGFIVIKKSLLLSLDCFWLGGSTVSSVKKDSYELISADEELYARLEPGLQNYAGIIGLGQAIQWRKNTKFGENSLSATEYEKELSVYLHQKIKNIPGLKLLNQNPSSVVSIHTPKIDGHQLGYFLAEAGIMCRTGYHCCHYYLQEKLQLPPLFRISLGLHNTKSEIDYLAEKLEQVLKLYS